MIVPKEKFKILGWHQTRTLSYKHHINQAASTIGHRMHCAAQFTKYMSKEARRLFANAHMFSHLAYGVPLFINESQEINTKYHQIFMKCARFAFGSYGFKKSCIQICGEIGKKDSIQEANIACAKVAHKIIQNKKPVNFINKIRFPRSRPNSDLALVRAPRLKVFKNTFINRIPKIYKSIPNQMKVLNQNQFKREIKSTRLDPP